MDCHRNVCLRFSQSAAHTVRAASVAHREAEKGGPFAQGRRYGVVQARGCACACTTTDEVPERGSAVTGELASGVAGGFALHSPTQLHGP